MSDGIEAVQSSINDMNKTLVQIQTTLDIQVVPLVKKHEKQIGGNGGKGLEIDVDRLKQSEGKRSWLLRTMLGCVVVLLVKALIEVTIG